MSLLCHDRRMNPAAPRPLDRLQRLGLGALRALPERFRSRLAGAPRLNAAGDRLDPDLQVLLRGMNRRPDAARRGPVLESRADTGRDAWATRDTFADFAVVEDLTIHGPDGDPLTLRRYRASTGAGAASGRGLLIWLHGGAWVSGGQATYDSPSRFLAQHADVDVLAVGYRLAPEHPFPAALDDARAAWEFAATQAEAWGVDPERIAIGGDSAGANLATVTALDLRGSERAPRYQLLFYPVADASSRRESHREFGTGHYLTSEMVSWGTEHYLSGGGQASDPRVSPLLTDDLSGAAPAFVAVAGFDPLRDEGLAYAQRLTEAGVPVQLAREGAMIHGYINLTWLSPGAAAATRRGAEALAAGLQGDQQRDR